MQVIGTAYIGKPHRHRGYRKRGTRFLERVNPFSQKVVKTVILCQIGTKMQVVSNPPWKTGTFSPNMKSLKKPIYRGLEISRQNDFFRKT